MRSVISLGQHHMWENLNTQFGSYINFYAEQEGLFPFLESQQKTPGKYSRQLAKNALIDMINGVQPDLQQQNPPPQNQHFNDVFETDDVAEKMSQKRFPKAGSNRNISEIDLRNWESLYIKSLKILKKNDLFKDIADNITLDPHELKIEYSWAVKDMVQLKGLLHFLVNPIQSQQSSRKFAVNQGCIQKVKYHLYQSFQLGIQPETPNRNLIFEENYKETIKYAIKQWAEVLPQYMDRVQNEYLILFQQIIESMEGGRNMISIQEMKRLQDYRCAMNIWRERLPNMCESIETWQDILESRNFIFKNLRENIVKQQLAQQGDIHLSIGMQEEPVDICWNNLKLASVSRKHGLYGLAQFYLNEVKAPLTDPETKGEFLKLERYRFTYENFKLHMITGVDQTVNQEVLREGLSFLDNKDYDPWMHAEILRLQGEYFLQRGDLANAKTKLISSIDKNRKEAKTWVSYAKLNEIVHAQGKEEKSLINSLKGYLCALSVSQHKARLVIPYILRLVKNKTHFQSKKVQDFVKQNVEQLPAWLWLFWIPQLLQFLKQPKLTLQRETARLIYVRLCKLYPQAAYYPLRAKNHYQKSLFVKEESVFKELLVMNKKYMIRKNNKALEGIESLIKDVQNLFKSKDEKFIHVLQGLLNFSQFIMNSQPQGMEKKISQFYVTIYESYLKGTNNPVLPEFFTHFINPQTLEPDVLKQMQILKNIKDFLVVQKSLKVQTQHIDEVFPSFANLNIKGIELPDQYIISAQEPLLEKVISIDRIDFTVHRSGWNDKKVVFRCQNSKSMVYAFSGLINSKTKQEQEVVQIQSDERVTQIKIIMNMHFNQHKESHIRGAKIHIAPRILLPGAKMSQDDLNFVDFQETHDFLLLEQGVDPDQALLHQLKQVKSIFEQFPVDQPKQLFQLDSDRVRQINKETYRNLTTLVEPHLLQSYFNRIFYNVDNLFIFKKQFTKYHAMNSFFSYIFNQSEQLKLNTLVFCKASGKFTFTDAKLSLALLKKETFKNRSFGEVDQDFYKVSHDRVNQQQEGNQENYSVPFRLTPNFVHFIGQIGLQGLFAGIMTSASIALTAQEEKFGTLLKLIFSDEIETTSVQAPASAVQPQPVQPSSPYDEDQIAEFCLFKIKSLSEHKFVLPQPQKNEEYKAQPIGGQKLPGIREENQNFILGQQNEFSVPREYFDLEMERPLVYEEFNKKVLNLIELAQEEGRRSQKPINWCAWF